MNIFGGWFYQGYFGFFHEIKLVNKKILIIDDMLEIVNVVSTFLRLEHYQIISATNGKDGIRLNELENPDLIILDLFMPEMDGTETLKQIRQTDSKVKVIILSGYINDEVKKGTSNLGINQYLGKPFDGNELLRVVIEVIGS